MMPTDMRPAPGRPRWPGVRWSELSRLARVAPRESVWTLALQLLLAASWTTYTVFLPGMLDQAGIDGRWLVPLLVLDQALFATADWAVGVYADKVARAARRLAPLVTTGGVVSSAFFILIPLAAREGAGLLVVVTGLWALTSAALRAPVFCLLGHIGGVSLRSGVVTGALVGISIAGALAPLLTTALDDVDPFVPIAVAAVALAAASFPAVRVELRSTKPVSDRRAADVRRVILYAMFVFVAAVGTQVHVVLASKGPAASVLGVRASLWQPLFWLGFAAGLPIGYRVARRAGRLSPAAAALLVGSVLMLMVRGLATAGWLYVVQPAVGAAWGVFVIIVIVEALRLGGNLGVGTAAGLVFSALALATLSRLLIGDSDLAPDSYLTTLPALAWAGSGAALLATARVIEPLPERRSAPAWPPPARSDTAAALPAPARNNSGFRDGASPAIAAGCVKPTQPGH